MNSSNESPPRITLAEAIELPQVDWDYSEGCPGIQVADLSLTNADRSRTVAVWHWLCDVHPTAKAAALVGNEVLTDGELIVALNLPAAEFMRWFRCEQWDTFDSTERTGSEAWAWGVLQRAREACDALGELALQQSLAPPPTWPGVGQ